MTSEEFWKDDPQLFVAYRTSFINKKKREMEELDYKCWLNGLYVYDGNNKLSEGIKQQIHNMLSGFYQNMQLDNRTIEKYMNKPLTELIKDEKNKKQIEQDKYKKQNEILVCQASIKQIYLEKIKRQNKG